MAISDLRFGSLDAELLDKFEESLGHGLPLDYRLFLESSNGGCLSPDAFRSSSLGEIVIVDVLFALDVEPDFDLRTWREECEGELPSNMLVIGGDPFGGLFVLGLETQGVYFWDQAGRLAASSKNGNAYSISRNFSSFMIELTGYTTGEIKGLLGKKLLQNIWHDAGGGKMQEINRSTYSEFLRIGGFQLFRQYALRPAVIRAIWA